MLRKRFLCFNMSAEHYQRKKTFKENTILSIRDISINLEKVIIRFRKKQGRGLGLAICEGIIKTLGGIIWAESVENKGTTIFFSIKKEKTSLKNF